MDLTEAYYKLFLGLFLSFTILTFGVLKHILYKFEKKGRKTKKHKIIFIFPYLFYLCVIAVYLFLDPTIAYKELMWLKTSAVLIFAFISIFQIVRFWRN
ncbi:hypothetical protein [Chengkuizengella axinellae]|uniref:Uncharacterized protein n=1 Tax=Chengkuizengella axinellae TaxID=3064388 RepID=A0ABT9J1B7_9BACL|nr:hypothetical protein [Chengkuizengella sp. 2205SS18-9]MDP5274799.1 hypothetical protein [Chengkuizengella sp. 2205SS18-9]